MTKMELQGECKGVDIKHYLEIGTFLDVKDSHQQWRMAKIIDIKLNNFLTIYYDGWPQNKWNEEIKSNSPRIAPFRKKTIDYTGQKGSASRPFKLSIQKCQEYLNKLNYLQSNILSNNLQITPFEIVQFLRGQYFQFIDSLFTYTNYDSLDSMSMMLNILKRHLKFTVNYIEYLVHLLPQCEMGFYDYNKIYENQKTAFASAFSEILYNTYVILGGMEKKRHNFIINKENRAFLNILWNLIFQMNIDIEFNKDEDHFFYLQRMQLISFNFFKASQKLFESGIIPLSLLVKMVKIYKLLCVDSGNNFKNAQQKLFNTINLRFSNISEKQIKDLDIQEIEKLIKTYDEQFGWKNKHQAQLEIAAKFLKSVYFEKKLKGIVWIKDLVQGLKKDQNQQKLFTQKIIKHEILEQIFGHSMHIQILKRSFSIIIFLYKNVAKQELLNKIWNASINKDQQTMRIIYDLIIELIPYLKQQNLQFLFKNIKMLDFSQHCEIRIILLKKFTREAIKKVNSKETVNNICEENYFGSEILYELMLDKSKFMYPELAMKGLQYVLNFPSSKILKKFFIKQLIQNIKKNDSVYQSLQLLFQLSNFQNQNNFYKENLIHLDDFVKSLRIYMDIVKDKLKYKKFRSVQQYMQFVFDGKFIHSLNLKRRLLAIKQTARIDTLTDKMIKILWQIFKNEDWPFNFDTNQFHKFMMMQKRNQSRIQNQELAEFLKSVESYIFNQILCNYQNTCYIKMQQNQFMIFILLFKNQNIKKEKLKNCKYISVIETQLIGIDHLWNLFLNIQNKKALQKLIEFYAELILRVGQKLIEKIPQRIQQQIRKIMDVLFNAKSESDRLKLRLVQLIIKLFEFYQCRFKRNANSNKITNKYGIYIIINKEQLNKMPKRQYILKNATQNSNKNQFKLNLKINILDKIYVLRQQIADKLGIQPYQVCISSKGKFILIAQDTNLIKQYYSSSLVVSRRYCPSTYQYYIHKNKLNYWNPRLLISQNSFYLQALFSMLSSQNLELVSEVGMLFESMPINQKIKKEVQQNKINWNAYTGVYKGTYIFSIILNMCKDSLWVSRFKQKGNYNILKDYLNVIKQKNKMTPIHMKYIYLLTQLFKVIPNQTNDQRKISNLIMVISSVINCMNKDRNCIEQQDIQPTQFYSFSNQTKIVINIKEILRKHNQQIVAQIFFKHNQVNQNYQFINICLKGLIASPLDQLKNQLKELILYYLNYIKNKNDIYNKLLNLMTQTLQQSYYQFNSYIFFQLMYQVFKLFTIKINHFQLLKKLVIFVQNNKKEGKVFDGRLAGVNLMIDILLKKDIIEKNFNLDGFLKYLMEQCMFKIPINNKFEGPLFHFKETRQSAFKILVSLICNNSKYAQYIEKKLISFHHNCSWRTTKFCDWHISIKEERNMAGYIGLKNPACICYMNSFFQQLFMITSFRNSILKVRDPNYEKIAKQDNPLYQLKCLFLALSNSYKTYYDPKQFCNSFKIFEQKPINIMEQMDVDQFVNFLFSKIQDLIKQSDNKHIIKNHFEGCWYNYISCMEGSHYSIKQEPFLAVPIQVKNKKNLKQSLQSMMIGQVLNGDNAYFCQHCNKKVTATKIVCLKKLPKYFIVHLKRFQYDFNSMQRFKINTYYQFPMELNLQQYTYQGLNKKENKLFVDEEVEPPQYFYYKLRGIVIHMGYIQSGHYYSFIKNNQNEWIQFNDTIVKSFDPINIPQQAFGGEQKSRQMKSSFKQVDETAYGKQKIRNAYLLLYQRVNIQQQQQLIIQKEENINFQCGQFLNELKIENIRFYMQKYLFAPEYIDFVKNLCTIKNPPIKLIFTSFFTVIIRQKNKENTIKLIKNYLLKVLQNQQIAKWVLKNLSNIKILSQMFIYNGQKFKRKLIQCVINYALQFTKNIASIFEFINACIQCLSFEKGYFNQILKCIWNTLKLKKFPSQKIMEYLQTKKFVLRVIYFLYSIGVEEQIKDQITSIKDIPCQQQSEFGEGITPLQADPYFTKKKDKGIIQVSLKQRTYFWVIANELISNKYCINEIKLLKNQKQTIYRIINNDVPCKLQMNMIGKVFAFLAYRDKEFSEKLLNLISQGTSQKLYKDFRVYFSLLKHLLLIQDELRNYRIDLGLRKILKVWKQSNERYFNQNDMTQQWIIKLCSQFQLGQKQPKLVKWMSSNFQLWSTFFQYAKNNSGPSQQNIKKNVKHSYQNTHGPKNVLLLHNIKLPKTNTQSKKLASYKKQCFEKMRKGEELNKEYEEDSDEDLSIEEIKINSKLWLYSQEKVGFEKVFVCSVNENLLQLQRQDGNKFFQWKDNEYLTKVAYSLQVSNVQDSSQTDIDQQT